MRDFAPVASTPWIEIKQPPITSYAIVFLTDLTYVHNSTLSSEFDQIAAELEAAEREEEEKNEKSAGEESDEVCAPFRPPGQHFYKSNQFRIFPSSFRLRSDLIGTHSSL